MQNRSDKYLITHVLSLQEIGLWTILSFYYDPDDLIENVFIDKTFSLEPTKIFKILKHLEEMQIISKYKTTEGKYVLKLIRSLFIY